MSGIIPETYGNTGPWQRYVAKERAAREAYLAVTHRAQREYLSGPWPDREAYDHVERSAWITYYAAGRDAWRYYTAELTPPPPPPAPPAGNSGPYPVSGYYVEADTSQPHEPKFYPATGGNELWPSSCRATTATTRPRP